MCFGGGGFLGLGDAPSAPPAPTMPQMPAPPNMPGGPLSMMNYPTIANNIKGSFPNPMMGSPLMGSAQVSGANIAPWQSGLTPQTIQKGLGDIQGVYNTAGAMGNQFMQNAAHAGDAHYNPAISAFNNATNSNMMNVASMLASQRGTAANPGLAARNIGAMGANTQQQAVNQLGSLIGQYGMGQQQNAMGAYGLQGSMGNAYAQAGLANQGQQLQALAAQNAANVAMQSNINSSNVAMQSNLNSNLIAMQSNLNSNATQQYLGQLGSAGSMYNAGLGYNANIYGDQLGYLGNTYAAQMGVLNNNNRLNAQGSGGFLSGLGSMVGGVLPFLNKGGQVPRGYARGGRVKKMAEGGDSNSDNFSQQSGDDIQSFSGNDVSVSPTGAASMPNFDSGNGPRSMIGQMLKTMQGVEDSGSGDDNSPKRPYQMFNQKDASNIAGAIFGGGGLGERGGMPLSMPQIGSQFQGQDPQLARGGSVPPAQHVYVHHVHHMAQGGSIQPNNQPMRGPMIPNIGLAGSPNMQIAAPPTGLPMGNSQTRGGGPMPMQSGGGPMMNRGGPVRRGPRQ